MDMIRFVLMNVIRLVLIYMSRLQKADFEKSEIKAAKLKGRTSRMLPNLERRWKNRFPKKPKETHTSAEEANEMIEGLKVRKQIS